MRDEEDRIGGHADILLRDGVANASLRLASATRDAFCFVVLGGVFALAARLAIAAPVSAGPACHYFGTYYDGCLNHHGVAVIAYGLQVARDYQKSDASSDLQLIKRAFASDLDCNEYSDAPSLSPRARSIMQQNRCGHSGDSDPRKIPLAIDYQLPRHMILALHWDVHLSLFANHPPDQPEVTSHLRLVTSISGLCPNRQELDSIGIVGERSNDATDGVPESEFGAREWTLPTTNRRDLVFALVDTNLAKQPICEVVITSGTSTRRP